MFGDIDIETISTVPWFYNAWSMQYRQLTAKTPWNDGFMELAEVGLMGFPPFTNCSRDGTNKVSAVGSGSHSGGGGRGGSCFPTTAEAADERPVYTALNLDKNDMGFNILGTLSAVFRTSHVANMTLVSAVDTGWWENSCNQTHASASSPLNVLQSSASSSAASTAAAAAEALTTALGDAHGNVYQKREGLSDNGMANCSAWDTTFGVLHRGGFNHLLLSNTDFWQPSGWSIPRLFARLFGDYASPTIPPVGKNYQFIWEPDVAGILKQTRALQAPSFCLLVAPPPP